MAQHPAPLARASALPPALPPALASALAFALAAALIALGMAAQAQPVEPAAKPPPKPQAVVYTHATVQSVFASDDGSKQYIRLKLGPGSGLPFRTQTFRVRDPALIAPFPTGSAVGFTAARIDGENTLTALRAAPKMQRFDTR